MDEAAQTHNAHKGRRVLPVVPNHVASPIAAVHLRAQKPVAHHRDHHASVHHATVHHAVDRVAVKRIATVVLRDLTPTEVRNAVILMAEATADDHHRIKLDVLLPLAEALEQKPSSSELIATTMVHFPKTNSPLPSRDYTVA